MRSLGAKARQKSEQVDSYSCQKKRAASNKEMFGGVQFASMLATCQLPSNE